MANKNLFNNTPNVADADTVNEAGGRAYKMSDREALAQFAVTGTFNNTYYATGQDQLDKVLDVAYKVDPKFLAKVAIYSRKSGYMKDMPAALLAILASREDSSCYIDPVFNKVIDNGKMLRNFVQMTRSGKFGKKSLGSKCKRLVKNWFKKDPNWIFKNSIGSNPSLGDVIKLAHPRPVSREHEALFSYLIGKSDKSDRLPSLVLAYEEFKKNPCCATVPDVPFQLLSSLDIPESVWVEIAKNAGWHMTRMNLNTFQRHGVFDAPGMTKMIAERLVDEDQIMKSRVFPYQLLVAYKNANAPTKITNALQDAMEIATKNVPSFGDNIFVLPDVSGSMSSSVTGYRYGSTSTVRCVDVAGLMASCILRKNHEAVILPFDTRVHDVNLNPYDSVRTNTQKLAKYCGGGTNCSLPLSRIAESNQKVDLVIYISDNQSWLGRHYHGTGVSQAWAKIKRKNKNAKMVCIDIAPYDTTQAKNDDTVLNIGGFSDQIFSVIEHFVKYDGGTWVETIEQVSF